MTVLDDLKTALSHTAATVQIRVQIGDAGSIYQVAVSDLSSALGVPAVSHKSLKVAKPHLNIRSLPTLSGAVNGQLTQGDLIDVFDCTPVAADNFNWLQLVDGRGWIASEHTVAPDAPLSAVTTSSTTSAQPMSSAAVPIMSSLTWSLPFTANQRGVGLSAGGWAPNNAQLDLVRRNNVEVALVCAYEANQASLAIPALRNVGVKSYILRACTHEKPTTPQRFVDLSAPILKEYATALGSSDPLLIAIHNEPNLTNEGWGSAWIDGATFAQWWASVAASYRQLFPTAKLGFPALSPGGDVPGIRLQDSKFWQGAVDAINQADWIGVHFYWANADGSDINPPIATWRQVFGSQRPIIGTEVGPADNTLVCADAVRKAYQCFAAAGIPACAWLLDGAGAWQNAAWDLHNIVL